MSKYIKLEDAIRNINLEVTGRKEYTGDMKANLYFALDDLPTIEVSEDCISREGVYRAIIICGEVDNDLNHLYEVIENEPSVLPRRSCYRCGLRGDCEDSTVRTTEQSSTVGEWYRQTTDHFDYWECSECGMGVGLDDIKNYCPNCGAKMKGADDE